jgi:hypothetical protein
MRFDPDQGAPRPAAHKSSVHHFIFRCPTTGLNVQGTKMTDEADESPYTSQKCLACGGVHLVNSLSGKLMSEERPRPRPDPG